MGSTAPLTADGTASATGIQLDVLTGSESFTITVLQKGTDDDSIAAIEKLLAAIVLPRLP